MQTYLGKFSPETNHCHNCFAVVSAFNKGLSSRDTCRVLKDSKDSTEASAAQDAQDVAISKLNG